MIKKYISEKIVLIAIYAKCKYISTTMHSNDYQT